MFSLIAAMALAATPATAPTSERAVEVAGPQGPLAGTLRLAGKGAPVMLIVPGSGPTDRDGNNPLGVAAAPYRMLAEALSAKGVSTLRIDKRGIFGSKAAVADANQVTIADYAADVRAWVGEARQATGAGCVWVSGHSEGGLVALAAAQRPDGICGVVVISAPGRPLAITMREQLRSNPANAPLLDEALLAIATLEGGGTVDVAASPVPLKMLFNPAVQPYLRDLFSYDPAKLAGSFEGPLLVVQGGRDLQVGQSDAELLKAAHPGARLALFAEANHVLKTVPNDRGQNVASYGDPSLPLAPGIAETIAAFIHAGGK